MNSLKFDKLFICGPNIAVTDLNVLKEKEKKFNKISKMIRNSKNMKVKKKRRILTSIFWG